MIAMGSDPWESGVLSHEHHARLVARISQVSKDACIPPGYIWTALDKVCSTEAELTWARRFMFHRSEGFAGLLYTGRWEPTVEERMMALAGSLTRNFKRARVFTMDKVFDHIRQGDPPDARCLLLPTFCDDQEKGVDWKRSAVMDLLLSRFLEPDVQTVLYAPSLGAVSKLYGQAVADHIASHYQIFAGAVK
jgi:hypothetical protein